MDRRDNMVPDVVGAISRRDGEAMSDLLTAAAVALVVLAAVHGIAILLHWWP
jgi:hypothetical protein